MKKTHKLPEYKRRLVCPTLFFSAVCMLIGMTACLCIMSYFYVSSFSQSNDYISGDFWGLILVGLLYLGFIIILINNSFEYFGLLEIQQEGLLFRTIFRRPVFLPYSELLDVGIDYGFVSETQQFWLYFSLDKIPVKYCHKINRLPLSSRTMKIQYRDDLLAELLRLVPDRKVVSKLQKSQSVVNAFRGNTPKKA